MRVKMMEKRVSISHSMELQCFDTLLDYMGQRGFKYTDIRAAQKIRTAVKSSLIVQKNKWPLQTISQNKVSCLKECKVICDVL
jgi:hypothetical protein